MNYGMYLSATGVQSSLHKQDVYANNLANVDTIGFKPDAVYTRDRIVERVERGDARVSPQWMLEQLGGGHLVEPTRAMLSQGSLVQTGNAWDLALEGEGFLQVASTTNDAALTRDGRLEVNASGTLVMAATGRPVLDTGGRPISVDPSMRIDVDGDGTLRQNGIEVGRLALVQVDDSTALRKAGGNLFSVDTAQVTASAAATVRQGYTESSGVDPIKAMMAMTGAAKAVQSNARMMQYHDNILGDLFGRVGRVG